MNEYILSCGSTVDLTEEHLAKRNINVLHFHYRLGDVDYSDDFGKSLSYSELYKALSEGKNARTSQINTEEYIEAFTPILKAGNDIVHIELSSGISGSYQSALRAKDTLKELFPEREVYIVDSLAASSGFGLLVDLAADYRDQGHSAKEVAEYVENKRQHIHHLFFSTDLTQYIKGGRVSAAAGLFGTILHICPLLYVNPEGKLIPEKKLMGKKRAMSELLKEMKERALAHENYSGKCYLCNSDCEADAIEMKRLIEENFANLKGKCQIFNIGATIGCHSGKGTVAVFFEGEKRV